jgi:DNA (cytosine-5)-methyltransferase 1
MSSGQANAAIAEDKAHTLNATHETQTIATPYTASCFAQYTEGVGTVRASGGDLGGGSETLLTQPQPFRKTKLACSTTDNETWVPADASNTLNNFDLGDTRTTHAVVQPIAFNSKQSSTSQSPSFDDKSPTLDVAKAGGACVCHQMPGTVAPHIVQASELRLRGQITEQDTCPTLLANTKSGDNDPLAVQAITFQPGNLRREAGADPSFTTTTTLKASAGDQTPHVAYAQGVDLYNQTLTGDLHVPLRTAGGHGAPACMTPMAVRRLTPVECERLQGFPDNWSRISWKGKPEEQCPDGPRYKACGNSMAVPVMRWIGERIASVDAAL